MVEHFCSLSSSLSWKEPFLKDGIESSLTMSRRGPFEPSGLLRDPITVCWRLKRGRCREAHMKRVVDCHVSLVSHQSALMVSCIPPIRAHRGKVVASLPVRNSRPLHRWFRSEWCRPADTPSPFTARKTDARCFSSGERRTTCLPTPWQFPLYAKCVRSLKATRPSFTGARPHLARILPALHTLLAANK